MKVQENAGRAPRFPYHSAISHACAYKTREEVPASSLACLARFARLALTMRTLFEGERALQMKPSPPDHQQVRPDRNDNT